MVTLLTDTFVIIGMVDLTMPGELLVSSRVVSRLLRRRRRVRSLDRLARLFYGERGSWRTDMTNPGCPSQRNEIFCRPSRSRVPSDS